MHYVLLWGGRGRGGVVDILAPRRTLKCVGSLPNSFVRISLVLTFPPTWCTAIVLSCTLSLVVFSRIVIWRSPFVVEDLVHKIQAVLSLYRPIGWENWSRPWWVKVLRRYNKCLQHSSVAYISDSADERAVIVCRLEDQEIGPPAMYTMYPEMDRAACTGISWVIVRCGRLWFWGPQFASHVAIGCSGRNGNLIKLVKFSDPSEEKKIPQLELSLR